MDRATMLGLAALLALPVSLIATVSIDATERRCRVVEDWNFEGDRLLVERCSGKLGLRQNERVLGKIVRREP